MNNEPMHKLYSHTFSNYHALHCREIIVLLKDFFYEVFWRKKPDHVAKLNP